ncbi:MAG TPA: VCBS repeat-containing protein [Planctomycetota bacterium]|nr:VCBS repeat-containing protein [Planctomycetota bacterium]
MALLALASGAALLATLAGLPKRPPPGGPVSDAPAARDPGEQGPAQSAIRLPPVPHSPVDALRLKTAAGSDRFEVESLHEMLEPLLGTLKLLFLEPEGSGARAAASRVLSTRFRARPLGPGSERTLIDRDGVSAHEGVLDPALETRAEELPGRVRSFIAPLARLESAAFKVLGAERLAGTRTVESTIHYELAGEGPDRVRRGWSGTARLLWDSSEPEWRLDEWATREAFRVTLATRPFEDVTARALGSSASWKEILEPGIDHFRERLDAASGIDVYGHHGAAVGDPNGDGADDFYVAMPPGIPNLLYLGRGDGTFVDSSRGSGADLLDGTHQPLFLDLDNDQDDDLFLVTESGILVLLNDGTGRFSAVRDSLPEMADARSTPISAAAADYDQDGILDVYVCSYVFWRGTVGEVGSRLPFPYHEAHNGAPNFLLRGNGDGTFEDVTAKAGLDAGNDRFSFAASWGDYDGDGDPDLFVANDFGSKNLYRNEGDGTFREVTHEAGVEDVGAGMSVAWEDYDNDGDLDLYVGNMLSSAGRRVTGTSDYKSDTPELQRIYRRHARGNSLFKNRGDGTFEEVSEGTRAYFGRWAWASGFVDFNLDGREDIYVQNGFITNTKKDDL